jgi:cytochrome P450
MQSSRKPDGTCQSSRDESDSRLTKCDRYYTVSAMSLPRKTVTEVNWDGAIIPAKTMVLINAQAGNHGGY